MVRAALVSLLLILLATPLYGDVMQSMRVDALQGPAEDFTLNDLSGQPQSLSQWRGKLVLLNFWATWCGPCRSEMPGMERLWQRYRDEGLVIVAVSVDEGMERRVAKFVDILQLSYPILLDPESKVSDGYQVSGLPYSLLIDRNGELIARVVGEREWDSDEAFNLIEQLLVESQVEK